MTNEEFQKLVLEELQSIRKDMATKEDIDRLERLANDSMETLEQTYREVEKNCNIQAIQHESINILTLRELKNSSEIAALKRE